MSNILGSCLWFIPDGFYHSEGTGKFPSHEAICILNTGSKDANIEITLYFDEMEPKGGFTAICKAERTAYTYG